MRINIARSFTVLLAMVAVITLRAQPPAISNSSVLTTLSPNGVATLGFIVSQQYTQPLTALFRAVGPSLSQFGITNVVSSPHARIFNAQGQNIARSSYINTPNWNSLFMFAGAFPLSAGESAITAYNVAAVSTGSYTIQVSDDSGKGGSVLIEVYLIAGNFADGPPI